MNSDSAKSRDGESTQVIARTEQCEIQAAALNAAANAIVITDREGRISWVNPAFTSLTGYTPQEVIGHTPNVLKSGQHDAVFYRNLWDTILSGKVWSGEIINRRKDGTFYVEETTITPVRSTAGEITHFVAIKQDITARTNAELALAKSEARFRNFANTLPEFVIELDLQGNLTFANNNASEFLRDAGGGSKAGSTIWGLVAPGDRDRMLRKFQRVLRGEPSPPSEYKMVKRDGTSVHILSFSQAIVDDDKPSGVRVIAVDITERKRMEEAFRLSQFSVDCSSDAVFWLDADGRVLYANQSASSSLGYSTQELLTMSAQDFDPSYAPEVWPGHWSALKEAGFSRTESQHRRKDGRIFPVEVTRNYGKLDDKEYAFVFAQDISLRKQLEASLLEEKHLFDTLMTNVPDHIYFKDRDSRFLRVSKAHASGFGLSDVAEAVGKTDADFFTGEHAQQAFNDEQEIIRTGQPMTLDEKETWPDGDDTWVKTTKMPLRDHSGNIVGTFGISVDITRLKRAEEALRESLEFNKCIVESSHAGICVLDMAGCVVYMSSGGRKLLEMTPAEDIGHLRWLDFWKDSGTEATKDALALAARGGVGQYQGCFPTRKGGMRVWDVVISPITGMSRDNRRLLCVYVDITERRRLELQLAQAQKLEAIGQLAAGIAHEINTPIQYIGDNIRFLQDSFGELDKIHSACELLHGARDPVADQEILDALHNLTEQCDLPYYRVEIPKSLEQSLEGSQHVARIVCAMKEFSHPGPAEKSAVDLNKAIESTITVSRNEWKYVAEVLTELDPGLPYVPCVAGEINQVVLNLILNAAHAIADAINGQPGKKGIISVSTRRDGAWVEIRVRDTGTGIPASVRHKIFDPFFTTKDVGKGTGQGLAIAHDVVVQRHGGTITFETEAEVGTTFIVRLPIRPADDSGRDPQLSDSDGESMAGSMECGLELSGPELR